MNENILIRIFIILISTNIVNNSQIPSRYQFCNVKFYRYTKKISQLEHCGRDPVEDRAPRLSVSKFACVTSNQKLYMMTDILVLRYVVDILYENVR